MSDEQNGLFASVDALLEQAAAPDALPVPAERKRLREAAGLSQDQVAKALDVRRETVTGWEAGRTEPRPPARAAYIRLLDGLAARFPAPESPSDSALGPRTGPSVSSQPHAPTSPVLPAASPAAPVRAVSARRRWPGRQRPRLSRTRASPTGRSRSWTATARRTARAAWCWTARSPTFRHWWTGRWARRSSVRPPAPPGQGRRPADRAHRRPPCSATACPPRLGGRARAVRLPEDHRSSSSWRRRSGS